MLRLGRNPIDATVPYNADFYVVTGTIIPVVFLAIILEGGLWAWISDRIKTGSTITMPVRISVSLLQLLAAAILLAGTASEVLTLHVLLRQKASSATENMIFYSTVLLVILLGVVLAARVPGIFRVTSSVSLQIEEEEEVRWSGRCARRVIVPYPWLWGVLFVTDRRIVWMTTREHGLFAPATTEIGFEDQAEIRIDPSIGWTRYLPSNGPFFFPPVGHFFDISVSSGKKYHFCAEVKKGEMEELIRLLIQTSSTDLRIIRLGQAL